MSKCRHQYEVVCGCPEDFHDNGLFATTMIAERHYVCVKCNYVKTDPTNPTNPTKQTRQKRKVEIQSRETK